MAKNNKGKAAPMPIGKAIRQAGEGGITKQEFNEIAGNKPSGAVVQKLDQINKNLKQNDKAAIGLNAGASNMLIREASKQSPTGYNAYLSNIMGPAMGTGRFGTELQRRATEFGTDRNKSALVSGGQYMMPSGRTANVGFGKQYTYSGGGLGTGPYNSTNMPMNTGSNDVGPLAPGTAKTDVTTPIDEEVETPMTPDEMAQSSMDPAFSDYGDRFNLSNATGFKTQRKNRRMGIASTRSASQSRKNAPTTNTLGK
jgi:hypothetical protein